MKKMQQNLSEYDYALLVVMINYKIQNYLKKLFKFVNYL